MYDPPPYLILRCMNTVKPVLCRHPVLSRHECPRVVSSFLCFGQTPLRVPWCLLNTELVWCGNKKLLAHNMFWICSANSFEKVCWASWGLARSWFVETALITFIPTLLKQVWLWQSLNCHWQLVDEFISNSKFINEIENALHPCFVIITEFGVLYFFLSG